MKMDGTVESLERVYNNLMSSVATVIDSSSLDDTNATSKNLSREESLENLKQSWELFRVSCDRAEEFVDSLRQRIGSECLVDEATGGASSLSNSNPVVGIPPISAVKLEQMSKAVRWLVIDLQQGHSHPPSHLLNPNNPNTAPPPSEDLPPPSSS
eukprot:TRINITY_DN30178_c0_g1_i1.p1 TRINITY_DN30178_c0_g1~~TRINITY_DN30178_c0_g1_i1.p1  ORF type:complete len:155 (-),score=25.82 TRINITY_DN30178_c0_g1_i1:268-732(-)